MAGYFIQRMGPGSGQGCRDIEKHSLVQKPEEKGRGHYGSEGSRSWARWQAYSSDIARPVNWVQQREVYQFSVADIIISHIQWLQATHVYSLGQMSDTSLTQLKLTSLFESLIVISDLVCPKWSSCCSPQTCLSTVFPILFHTNCVLKLPRSKTLDSPSTPLAPYSKSSWLSFKIT